MADQEINLVEELGKDIAETPVVNKSDLIYGLNDKPPVVEAIFVACQHVLAAFVGIITPPIIICASLGLDAANTSYLISMSLFTSGICTYIQCKKIGPIGSGLLSLQGTSFAFLAPILGVGTASLQRGDSPEQALALIFGVCLFVSFVIIVLIKTGMISLAGGAVALAKNDGSFGSFQNLALGGAVLFIVVVLTLSPNRYLRMGAIAIGLAVGFIASLFFGIVNFSTFSQMPFFRLPVPFRYGISFDFGAFLPFVLIYILTAIETVGDLTATSAVSGEPVSGGVYVRRIKGGVLGDGINSLIAAVLNTFPNTTFSQNNGVIQMTGVGSRYVGFYVAGIFVILGLLPFVGGIFQSIPQPVLGGATLVLFGSIAVAGLNIVVSAGLDRRSIIIVAVSLGLGLGVIFAPEIFVGKPAIFSNLFGSSISTGGLTAILLSWLLPRSEEAALVEQEHPV